MSQGKTADSVPRPEIWRRSGAPEHGGGAAYGVMIEALRDFQDKIAAARPDEATAEAMTRDLAAWSKRLASLAVSEPEQLFGHRQDLAGRGQTMTPALIVTQGDVRTITGEITFGRYFLGSNGAAHGGAVALVFDEVLGRLANLDGVWSRTAYLHVDYRSITPIETRLDVKGWFVSEEGRKRLLRAELRHGDILCAEAEGLFVRLKPDQS